MPGNAAATLGGPAGLQLKAWARFTGAGAFLSGFNATASVQVVLGQVRVTLSPALADTNAIAVVRNTSNSAGPSTWTANILTTTAVDVYTKDNGAAAAAQTVHLEVWAP